ncbi:LLM class flavin-dependent oxidoreductase [Streptomyces monashensis]|uniref:Monooxygenase n=1 Tax=Streptomyces monashensis TaxID=1678012 RepID=A0A1S2Q163_9ACTN|nr:LLM class flavin-dependent oxidoreductase [Streptomyces monashensis]OIJ99849.1 monooxygenase [Streptomyces monashensis]
MSARRRLHLNAFLMEAGHHEAAWRLPRSSPRADFDLRHWIELAQLAESATFDSLFLADGPALIGTGEFRPPGQLEPLILLTALSQATSRIGLIATVSTTYNEPYNLARRLASVDHVSEGRAGWNIVTSAGADEAANFGRDDRPGHAERYARADEFLEVAKALWDSWEAGAVIADRTTGRYADPARLHRLGHQGRYFKVAGPLNVERPPQGYPLLVQAGSSEDGKDFAARHAEAVFTAHTTYERAAAFYADIKARTRAAGRDPNGLIVLPGIVPYIGSTEEEARALAREFDELRIPEYGLRQLAAVFETEPSVFELDELLPDSILARPKLEGSQSRSDLIIDLAVRERLTVRQIISRLGGGRGHFESVGTPEQIADTIIAWFEGGAADGFNIMAPALPSGLAAFAEHVLPILRGKGLFREEYEGTTLREHYGLQVPANQFHG